VPEDTDDVTKAIKMESFTLNLIKLRGMVLAALAHMPQAGI
jgi:hypothetical protein